MQAPRDPAARRGFILATLLALMSALAIAVVWTAPEPALDGASEAITWLRGGANDAGRAMATTVLVALAAIAYLIAWGRATSRRRPVRIGDGRGTISVEELEWRLRAAMLDRPDVTDAATRLENLHRRGVRVSLLLGVTPDARLAETTADAGAQAAELLREVAGVALAEPPAIELHYEELILAPGSRRRESDAA